MNPCAVKKIFIFAGEPSGDLHGGHLIQAVKTLQPNVTFEGVGGPKMRTHDFKTLLNMEDFQVMGLTDVLLALPKLVKHFYNVKDRIISTNPDAVILIDYPGFNLRLAKALRHQGYIGKIIQYVSPSVWAWGAHRIKTMNDSLDLLMTIYPFETKSFSHTTLPVSYVSNPICEYLSEYQYDDEWKRTLRLPEVKELIAIFPGSRQSEISRNLPILLEAAKLFKQECPEALFAISSANPSTTDLIKQHLAANPHSFNQDVCLVPKDYTYELMRDCKTAIAKSGTVTLELALHGKPTVVMYKLTLLNRLYATYILKLKLPYYCIVNILNNSQIFPELIEKKLTANSLFQELKALHSEGVKRHDCIDDCHKLSLTLGKNKASILAAESVLRCLKC